MYVISRNWKEKPGQPVTSWAFFMLFLNVERPRAFRAQLTNFTCFRGSKVVLRRLRSNSLVSLSHTDKNQHLQATSEEKKKCSSVFFVCVWAIVWFVSSLGGLVEHSFCWRHKTSGGAHLMGHVVKGDGADTISQSRNAPGSLNLGRFTYSRLPDKTGCWLRNAEILFFIFENFFDTKDMQSVFRYRTR